MRGTGVGTRAEHSAARTSRGASRAFASAVLADRADRLADRREHGSESTQADRMVAVAARKRECADSPDGLVARLYATRGDAARLTLLLSALPANPDECAHAIATLPMWARGMAHDAISARAVASTGHFRPFPAMATPQEDARTARAPNAPPRGGR